MIRYAPQIKKTGKCRLLVTEANAFVMGTSPFAQFDEYIELSEGNKAPKEGLHPILANYQC